MGERPVILKAERLHKSYRMGATRVSVLKGVDLTVEQGQFVAVIGAPEAARARCCTCWAAWIDPTKERSVLTGRI